MQLNSTWSDGGTQRAGAARERQILLLVLLLAVPLLPQSKPCIAYVSNGELRARCNGQDRMLLQRSGVLAFAIGPGGGTVLGAQNWAYLVRRGVGTELRIPPVTSVHSLYAACGAALAPGGNDPTGSQSVDVITGKPVAVAGLQMPQCSADRSLVAGMDSAGDLVTNRGKILARRSDYVLAFAVSPSGRWFARMSEAHKLCISDTRAWSTRCYYDAHADPQYGSLSLNDDGEALFEQGAGETCWVGERGSIQRRKKFAGAIQVECSGVAVASPTSPPRLILRLGFRPAWVDKKVLQDQFGAFKN